MKQLLPALLIAVAFFSCENNSTIKTEREGEPTIYSVKDDDEEMNDAINKAKHTLGDFKKALASNNPAYAEFCIKMSFVKPDGGGEHIWLNQIVEKDNAYFGSVGNVPEYITGIKLGDTLQIDNDRISDWMYVHNDTLCGGYTLRLIRNRMDEAERSLFDSENGLIIKE